MITKSAMVFLALILALAGSADAQDASEPDPQALLDAAVAQLQSAASFRVSIAQRGEPYPLAVTFDGVNTLPGSLENAEAQYVNPGELHISALVRLIIPLSLDVYALDDRQWLSFPSGAPWFQLPAFEGFDVNRLLAADDGIEKVMTELREPRIAAALIDERPAWHIQATSAGDAVEGLLFGFIDPEDDVEIDAYLTAEDGRLALIEILMLETADDPSLEPSTWHVKFYDYDAPRGFDAPE